MIEKTALIINGAEPREPAALGRLNSHLFETFELQLRPTHHILSTIIQNGYDVATEQEKFRQADLIIFQIPVFWFSLPSTMKRYIDDVYAYGKFFGRSEQYGRGGLLTGKSYMLSSTWNAKSLDFGSSTGFLGMRTPDEILVAFHLTQQYVGLKPLPSFTEYNVIQSGDAEGAARRLKAHLMSNGIGK